MFRPNERERCDTADKKEIAELKKKVAALAAVVKSSCAKAAAAQRSETKAKNHWEVHREADFRLLADQVGLEQSKMDHMKEKLNQMRRHMTETTNEVSRRQQGAWCASGPRERENNANEDQAALSTAAVDAPEDSRTAEGRECHSRSEDVSGYHEEVLEEEVVGAEVAVERVTPVNECGGSWTPVAI
jgi:hypothetical protein